MIAHHGTATRHYAPQSSVLPGCTTAGIAPNRATISEIGNRRQRVCAIGFRERLLPT
ncbi:Uncharacterized protein pbN1_08140 [Aromatoleum bremense]|nr:Uncharacterized protein pbN1_08140 [Aromatoleum bremense]